MLDAIGSFFNVIFVIVKATVLFFLPGFIICILEEIFNNRK